MVVWACGSTFIDVLKAPYGYYFKFTLVVIDISADIHI